MLKSNVFLKGRAKQATANASQLDLNFRTFNSSSHPLVAWYDFTDIPTMYKEWYTCFDIDKKNIERIDK